MVVGFRVFKEQNRKGDPDTDSSLLCGALLLREKVIRTAVSSGVGFFVLLCFVFSG